MTPPRRRAWPPPSRQVQRRPEPDRKPFRAPLKIGRSGPMPKFDVDIPHALPPEEAKNRLAGAAPKLGKDYCPTCTWQGDPQLTGHRRGLDAKAQLEAQPTRLEVSHGFLL